MFGNSTIRVLLPFAAALVCGSLSAQTPAAHYIVELTDPPAAEHFRGRQHAARPGVTELSTHRESVRIGQTALRTMLENEGATIQGSTQIVSNSLIVTVQEDRIATISKMPGVKRVFKARQFKPMLDHAVAVHAVDQVWKQIGIDKAGAGIKIGILDTGVDNNHPSFSGTALTAPAGFPLTNADTDIAYTNGKVIVARSYVSLLDSTDVDNSARDHVGHGTGTAMCAAGATSTGPAGPITGMAPAAYIGNYKIFGTPTYNDTANDAAILQALDDAVADGMDIISMSVGSLIASRLADDAEVAAVEHASSLGVIVVLSAGNGDAAATVFSAFSISSPGTAPSAITVGASSNSRDFASSASLPDGTTYKAVNSQTAPTTGQISAQVVDVAPLDNNGLACNALPAGKLSGKIAFILRGTCTFEVKLANAQAAGAIGALVYTVQSDPDPIPMGVTASKLPAQMVSYNDGVALKAAIAANSNLNITLTFAVSAVPVDPNRVALWSSRGPNVDYGVKPDLLAVGTSVYTATQSFDNTGEMYDPSGYTVVDGTSFAAPITAGATAVLKAAKSGLTAAQYRSLMVNSTASLPSSPGVQSTGAGLMNLANAVASNVAIAPVSVSFGVGTANISSKKPLTLANLSTTADTYTVAVKPVAGSAAPTVDNTSLTIAGGATATLNVLFTATGLPAGSYEGIIAITSASTGVESHVAYWFAVPSTVAAYMVILEEPTDAVLSSSVQLDAVFFHVTDPSGIPLTNIKPQGSVTAGGGSIIGFNNYNSSAPGLYSLDVRMGPKSKTDNTFQITVGGVVRTVTITTK